VNGLKRLCAVCLAILLLTQTGCQRLLHRTVYTQSPHLELPVSNDIEGVLVSSYAQMLNVVSSWVRAGQSDGLLRVTSGYSGILQEDVANVCEELMYNEAYSRFVEPYLVTSSDVKASGTTVLFNIKYMRERDQVEIDSLQVASGQAALERLLQRCLLEYQPYLAVEVPFFDETVFDFKTFLEDSYLEHPEQALGLPDAALVLYRGLKGSQCILEFRFTYPTSMDNMLSTEQRVSQGLTAIRAKVKPGETHMETIRSIHDTLAETIDYDFDTQAQDSMFGLYRTGRSYTMVGAMIDNKSVAEGYALAVKALCDLNQIPCRVVMGDLVSEQRAWNLVNIDQKWYHMDVAADDALGYSVDVFLHSDEEMLQGLYTWDQMKYPDAEWPMPILEIELVEDPEETDVPQEDTED
jgi:hypothetical protein